MQEHACFLKMQHQDNLLTAQGMEPEGIKSLSIQIREGVGKKDFLPLFIHIGEEENLR